MSELIEKKFPDPVPGMLYYTLEKDRWFLVISVDADDKTLWVMKNFTCMVVSKYRFTFWDDLWNGNREHYQVWRSWVVLLP